MQPSLAPPQRPPPNLSPPTSRACAPDPTPSPGPWGPTAAHAPSAQGDASTCDPPDGPGCASRLPGPGRRARESRGWGGSRAGNSLGRRLRASTWQVCFLQAPRPEDPTREALGELGGGPLVGECPRPPWLGNHAHPNSKGVSRGRAWRTGGPKGMPARVERAVALAPCGGRGPSLRPAHLSGLSRRPPPAQPPRPLSAPRASEGPPRSLQEPRPRSARRLVSIRAVPALTSRGAGRGDPRLRSSRS